MAVSVGVLVGVGVSVGVGVFVGVLVEVLVLVGVEVGVSVSVGIGPLTVGGRLMMRVRRKDSTMPSRSEVSRSTGQAWLMSGLIKGWV